jgi:signal transduction histidine kinase
MRTVRRAMRRALSRLRWQLTLSHLTATAFTLVCMIAAVVLIATAAIAWQDSPRREPVRDARTVAESAAGLITRGEPGDLNAVLRALAAGNLRAPTGGWAWGSGSSQHGPWMEHSLQHITYIVAVGPDGQLLGSSDPSGTTFAPAEREEWRTITVAALGGGRDLSDLVVVRNGGGPAALGAYPVLDEGGQPIAAVLVAKSALSPSGGGFNVWRTLAIFGAASVAVLAAASVFALASSGLVAYLLSRRLVARLERLGRAAESLAAGDLSSRVEEGRPDEVGRLARRFNDMAADLERTLSDLQDERDRVSGLLDARRQLVAGVSHELRTPVATVRGYLESALRRDGTVSGELRADLETMEREVARLQRLIEDLFTLSRATVGRLELRLGPTDVGAVVRRLTDTMAPLAWGQRRVQVIAEVAPELPPARADAQRLEQIVSNLLGNAVRHTPPGGLVAAAIAAEPEVVRVEVRDTGEGIAAEDLPHVFERFYRGRNGESDGDESGGAGLGLALVKELVEAMGGSVEATSTPGEGSCFTVRLPRD